MTPAPSRTSGLLVPACLVGLAAVSAALACAFYFRGPGGDYNLHNVMEPATRLNEYVPADASATLAFPRLGLFLGLWAAVVLGGWLAVGRLVARRERLRGREALRRAAAVSYPLIALLLVPAHHYLGLPLTLGPVFLMIFCVGLSAAVAGYVVQPKFAGRLARAVCSVWGVWVLAAGYSAVFSMLMIREYQALSLGYHDSGAFAEAVHHASQGEALRTNLQDTGIVMRAHCTLILVPLSHLYKLWPCHELLLVVQSVGLGLGGVAVYLLARAVLRDRFAAWAFAVAYYLAATTAFVNLPNTYGFRPLSLIVPTLLWAICFLERGRPLWFFLFVLLALWCKEEAAPAVVMLGVFIAARHRRWAVAAGTIALSIAWYVLAMKVIMPTMNGGAKPFIRHLDDYGTTAGDILANVAKDPLRWLAFVFGDRVKLFFLLHLLVPLLLLPLLSPTATLVWLASFTILATSSWYGKYIILIGAQAAVLPGLYLSAVYGLRNLGERRAWLVRRLIRGDPQRIVRSAALGLLAAAALTHYFLFLRTMPWRRYVVTERHRMVGELRQRIPRDASVCASYRLASHFIDQRDLYLARDDPDRPGVADVPITWADYVVLDSHDSWAGMATIARYRSAVLRSGRYGAVFAQDGFLIFQRGARGIDIDNAYRPPKGREPSHRWGETLQGFATLLGYDAQQTDAGLELTLYWKCWETTAVDCAVKLAVAGAPGAWRHLPADGLLPTWAWRPGDVVLDRVTLRNLGLPPDGLPPLRDVAFEAFFPPHPSPP